jgi:Flp pilus assembly protein TadB
MDAVNNGSVVHSKVATRRPARASSTHKVLATLFIIMAICAVTAVVVAVNLGHVTVGLIIGIVASAFFTGYYC